MFVISVQARYCTVLYYNTALYRAQYLLVFFGMYLKYQKSYIHFNGGGFSPEYFENKISIYELEVMTRTCTNSFGEVFGPCAHCCLCEALEQKRPKNHKP